MSKYRVEFRDTIPWSGLEWDTSLKLPARLLRHLAETEMSDQERLVILRLYQLLQESPQHPDAALLARWPQERQSCIASWIDSSAPVTDSLRPLYKMLYPELGKAGYEMFIHGELFSYVYPHQILLMLKAIPLNTAEGKPKNCTAHFIFAFLVQLAAKPAQKVLRDDFYCGTQQLNTGMDALRFALVKVCLGRSTEFDLTVTDGTLYSQVLEADTITMDGEESVYDQATRLFYRLRYGDEIESRITKEVLDRWQFEWMRMCKESNLDMETVIDALPAIFEKRDPSKVPSPFANFSDPAANLGGLILAERHQRRSKVKKSRLNTL